MNIKRLAVIITTGAMALSLAAPVGAASPSGKADSKGHGKDNLPGALAIKQEALKARARELVWKGQATAQGKNQVVKLPSGQFVELAPEIVVLYRFFVHRLPAARFPSRNPTGNAFA